MQSQQKRVKWSRGETAQALEERTDTGITQASVELMENCIPDIYGNVSRRPVLSLYNRLIGQSGPYTFGFVYDKYLQVIPFYITETELILVGVHFNRETEFLYINTDTGLVSKLTNNNTYGPLTKCPTSTIIPAQYVYKQVSYAQQGNYLVIADAFNTWKITFSFTSNIPTSVNIELWKFSAGWYAQSGTKTRAVGKDAIANLSFSGNFSNYIFTDSTTNSVVYSMTSTGLTIADLNTIKAYIPVGSIVQFPNNGAYLRVEGYDVGGTNLIYPDRVFDGVLNPSDTVPSTGLYCQTGVAGSGFLSQGYMKAYSDGTLVDTVYMANQLTYCVRNSNAAYGLSKATLSYYSSNFHWSNWQDVPSSDVKLFIYGALLTPVADENATDTLVNVEYGYESLMPEEWNTLASYPHPKKLVFNNQRLWAGAWAFSTVDEYAICIGSQIARYNDFKNDYNQENEPITLDILTQFKEKILHLIDYNGLKIMTDSYEYSYDTSGGIVKNSANGSLENCQPIVFDSLCMYIDSTGCQVKVMQYELQADIFNSSTINQLASHDLVWYPFAMAAYEDKVNSTGKYLFLVNEEDTNHPRVAVCNFVPGNQVNIWNRWSFPKTTLPFSEGTVSLIHSVVHTKKETIFMVTLNQLDISLNVAKAYIFPAYIDWNKTCDFETPVSTVNNVNYYRIALDGEDSEHITMSNTTVAVYADGEFKWLDTTTNKGALTRDISSLTNVTIGLPVNAKIVSHPIDVGGKTKSIKKRIGKARMSVHDTEPGAITINGKTGYMNPAKDAISFYGVTGMKQEIKYTLTNNNGAMFHLESLLMNIEYGTLDS